MEMSDWRGKKVLITGAGGFIGSHLTEKMVGLGASVRAFVRYVGNGSRGWLNTASSANEIEFIAGDLRDGDSVRRAVAGCDVVFHLGALIGIPYSYEAPQAYLGTNIQGTLNVVQAARDFGGVKVIHTSTSEVYGTALRVPIDEDHPLQGQSPYSASKIGADMLAMSFNLSFGLPVVTVRPFNTYGPRQSARAVIPTIITQVLAANEVRLGSLSPTRDLNFVADTVDGFIAAAMADQAVGQTINLGTGKEISIGDLAKAIMRQAGREVPIICEQERLRPANSEVERLCASNERAKALLNWQPLHTLDQGLAQTIEWVRANMGAFRIGEYCR